MQHLFSGIYKNKTVLVTGHTGFKGSWLSVWLKEIGADVIGYSLKANTDPNHFELLNPDFVSVIGDIRDSEKLNEVFELYKPDIVFHLAAQPLVRLSYENPVETYETNVIGTLKVFEACKKHKVKAIVNITSDKCYENKEWIWGYRENDTMGGFDPYSSSKGCSELLTASYRNSFFSLNNYGKQHNTLLASCRAGNVIGGGDWASDRLVPDIIRASSESVITEIRNPHAVRPWQHVLESLSGYLFLGQKLLQEETEYAEAWNFGPDEVSNKEVIDVINMMHQCWDKVNFKIVQNTSAPHEAHLLRLDSTKARVKLNWKPVWNTEKVVKETAEWYKSFYEEKTILTYLQLKRFVDDAEAANASWVTDENNKY